MLPKICNNNIQLNLVLHLKPISRTFSRAHWHKDLFSRGEFTKYAKAFPLAKTLGWKISSKWYRRTVGGLEIVCGLVMLCIPSGFLKRFANLVLFITKLINAYSHWAIGDAYERWKVFQKSVYPTDICVLPKHWHCKGQESFKISNFEHATHKIQRWLDPDWH